MVCILEEVFKHGRSLSEHRAVILARAGESFDTPSRSGRNGVNFVIVRTKRVRRLLCVPKRAEAESSFLSANAVVSLGYIVSIDEVLKEAFI